VADGRVTPFDGDLDDYQRMILSATADEERAPARGARSGKAEQRREAANKRQALKPLKDAMDKWEREVTALNGEIGTIDAQLAAPRLFDKDPAKGQALAKKRADAVRALAAAESRWIEAAERYEAAQEAEA
jgi:ATP-binding cassette subfamily F protein 3